MSSCWAPPGFWLSILKSKDDFLLLFGSEPRPVGGAFLICRTVVLSRNPSPFFAWVKRKSEHTFERLGFIFSSFRGGVYRGRRLSNCRPLVWNSPPKVIWLLSEGFRCTSSGAYRPPLRFFFSPPHLLVPFWLLAIGFPCLPNFAMHFSRTSRTFTFPEPEKPSCCSSAPLLLRSWSARS